MDLGEYTTKFSGIKRHRMVGWDPEHDAMYQCHKKVSRTVARGLCGKRPLLIRRYAFKLWMKNMFTNRECRSYNIDFKLKVLNQFMRHVHTYIIPGKYLAPWVSNDAYKNLLGFMLSRAKMDVVNGMRKGKSAEKVVNAIAVEALE